MCAASLKALQTIFKKDGRLSYLRVPLRAVWEQEGHHKRVFCKGS